MGEGPKRNVSLGMLAKGLGSLTLEDMMAASKGFTRLGKT